jgi:hypothetical protein
LRYHQSTSCRAWQQKPEGPQLPTDTSGKFSSLHQRPYKVLALQVELCSPRLIASRDDARWRPSGFRPGFWPQGQLT